LPAFRGAGYSVTWTKQKRNKISPTKQVDSDVNDEQAGSDDGVFAVSEVADADLIRTG